MRCYNSRGKMHQTQLSDSKLAMTFLQLPTNVYLVMEKQNIPPKIQQNETEYDWSESMSMPLRSSLSSGNVKIIVNVFHDFETVQGLLNAERFFDTKMYLRPVMCSVIFDIEFVNLQQLLTGSNVDEDIESYLISVINLSLTNARFRRFNEVFDSFKQDSLRNTWIYTCTETGTKNVSAAAAYATFNNNVVDHLLNISAPLLVIRHEISLRSFSFNGKRFDELFTTQERYGLKHFANMQLMSKGSKITYACCQWYNNKFTFKVTFTICDLLSWFPGSNLRNALKSYKCEVAKGDAPLILYEKAFSNERLRFQPDYPERQHFRDVDQEVYASSKDKWVARNHTMYDVFADVGAYCCYDSLALVNLKRRVDDFAKKEIDVDLCGLKTDPFSQSGIAMFSWNIWLTECNLFSRPIYSPQGSCYETIKKGYFGGRVNMWYRGEIDTTNVNSAYYGQKFDLVDVTSLYPLAMTGPMPSGRHLNMIESDRLQINNFFEVKRQTILNVTDIKPFCALCSLTPPANKKLLPFYALLPNKRVVPKNELIIHSTYTSKIPAKGLMRTVWDHKTKTLTLDSITACVAHNHGFRVRLLRERKNVRFEAWRYDTRRRIMRFKHLKEAATDGSLQRNVAKIMLNAMYGAMCRRNDGSKTGLLRGSFQRNKLLAEVSEGKTVITKMTQIQSGSGKQMMLVTAKPSEICARNREVLHLGAACTAHSNAIMADILLRQTLPKTARVPGCRLPPVVYSDTDSLYVVQKYTHKFEQSQIIGTYSIARKRFEPTVKVELSNIDYLLLCGLKFMFASNGDDNLLKAKGHPKKEGEKTVGLSRQRLKLLLQNRCDVESTSRTILKANLTPQWGGKSPTAFTIHESVLERKIRIPPIAGVSGKHLPRVVQPYVDND